MATNNLRLALIVAILEVLLAGHALAQEDSGQSLSDRLQNLREAQRNAQSKNDLTAVAADALRLAQDGVITQDQRTATQALNLAATIARGIGNEFLASVCKQQQDELRLMGREASAIRRVTQKVDAGNAKPDEVGIAGQYHSLLWEDWERGLPLLEQSDDSTLRQIAALESAPPEELEPQLELASAWAANADRQKGLLQARAFDRAHYWFRQALGQAGEDQAAEIRSKMEVLPSRYLTDLEPVNVKPGPWPFARYGDAGEGHLIKINGLRYPLGIGLHPPDAGFASVQYALDGEFQRLFIGAALNDSTIDFAGEQILFWVLGDGKPLWRISLKERGVAAAQFVDVSGVNLLELRTEAPGNAHGGHAVWLDPVLSK